jgi:hypothetical protein
MLMGRKPAYMSGFRPINIPGARMGDERAEPVDFPAKASHPGRLDGGHSLPGSPSRRPGPISDGRNGPNPLQD